jgi:hypothetical protein
MGNENERKPVSPQKLAANLANAQHSTGPRTEAGKEKSAQNSYQHGLYAKRLFPTSLDRDRDGADFDLIAEGVFDYYRPVGFMEKFWAEKVAIEMFRMARGLGYEQRFLDYRSSGLPSLESILRFQASNNRQLAQAIEELERLQARRRARSKQNVLSDAEEDKLVGFVS